MFKSAIRSLCYTTGLLLFFSGFTLFGQESIIDIQKVRVQSMASFDTGDFRSALSGYRKLMKRDPEDAMYSYYAGRCLVELNQHLDEAIELLYGASTRGVPNNVNFYLGKAYHRDYNFTDAQKYYSRFELEASRQELKEYNIKHLIATCRSARTITATYNPYKLMNVTFIDLFDSLQYTQVKMKGGHLQRKPASYFKDDEEPNSLTSLMFIPPNAGRGDYLYYSGYGRSGKEGAQLFRVRKGGTRAFSEPQEIKALNTEGDEILPYFDPIENDLYFASNGRLGIGGYDLYRSHYDSERDQWSEPLNLGFPVNSVMDEYLLLPGSDLGMVMFFSTRQGTDTTVTVYRMHLIEPKKKTVVNDYAMLKDIAYLGGAAAEILAELQALEMDDATVVAPRKVVIESESAVAGEPMITPVKVLSGSVTKASYQVTLAEALRYQAVSDSLKDLATEARVKVRESDDPNDRWVWQKQIMLWEKKAKDEEEMADELYAQVEMERTVQSKKPAVNVPETIQVDTVMEDLTVYRYTVISDGEGGEPGTTPVSTYTSPGPTYTSPGSTSIKSSKSETAKSPVTHMNRFDILKQSPYSTGNPIPMDVTLPDGILYRVQLGAFGTEVNPDAFGGITPITGERIRERGLIKYFAGKFSVYNEASTALSIVRSSGFEDAFLVAWYNGSPVSTQKAKQLE